MERLPWQALHHHALLTLLAFAFPSICAYGKSAEPADAGPPPRPTLPEVRRRFGEALMRIVLRCPHRRCRIE